MPNNHYKISKVTKLPNAEAEVTGEIALPFLVECRKDALKSLSENVTLPGFRKGHIPEDVLIKNVGEMRILEESAEVALGKEYQNIIKEAKLSPIGRPEIKIIKLAPGIPLEFQVNVSLEPEFDLPDYKEIASGARKEFAEKTKKDELEVSEKEIKDVVEEISKRDIKPDLNEGEKLEDKIKENLLEEKKHRFNEKRRLSIIESLVDKTKIEIPKVLIESEKSKMLGQFKADVERMGIKWEDYLQQAKKTEEDMKDEWQEQALKRVKAELVVIKISEKENLEPQEGEVEKEAQHIMSHYPDADPLRARIFAFTQLRNQKVMEFLDSEEEKKQDKKEEKPKNNS